jgi:hypothetical protein
VRGRRREGREKEKMREGRKRMFNVPATHNAFASLRKKSGEAKCVIQFVFQLQKPMSHVSHIAEETAVLCI